MDEKEFFTKDEIEFIKHKLVVYKNLRESNINTSLTDVRLEALFEFFECKFSNVNTDKD